MTLFIPEGQSSTGAMLQSRRMFRKLEGDYVVRTTLGQDHWAPDLFLQHEPYRWLAIVVFEQSFEALDPAQLFATEQQARFRALLAQMHALGSSGAGKLVVMWDCDSQQSEVLWNHYAKTHDIRLMSKKTFIEQGHVQLPRLLGQLTSNAHQALMSQYFPEAEIPGLCTTRRQMVRDNSAKATRFFLDAQQEWASKLDLELPFEQVETVADFSVRLVNGVAGSGKTLIAANRAMILARRFPDQQVLMLIHNAPVVKDLLHRLKTAYGDKPANLTIKTASSWVRQQWVNRFHEQPEMPFTDGPATALIQHYRDLTCPDLKPSNAQVLDEFHFINDTVIAGQADYLVVDRAGQGFALRKEERQQIWSLYEKVSTALLTQTPRLRLWSALGRDLCLASEPEKLTRYHHILVDEAQFFAPSWFQLLNATLQQSQGTLFLCADPNQGFLKSRLSWKRVGLDVSGKTKKLRRSYRTTQALLSAAGQLLADLTQTDPDDYLQPDFTGMDEGTPPLLLLSSSTQDALEQACNELIALRETQGLPLSRMLLLYGPSTDRKQLIKRLEQALGAQHVWNLNTKDAAPNKTDSLRIANLDSATGLEAHTVLLIGLEHLFDAQRLERASDNDREQNARRLYMAMTRASQRLMLVSSKRLPERMGALFEQV